MMKCLPLLCMAVSMVALLPLVGLAAWAPEVIGAVEGKNLIYLATQRRDGTRSKAAPIWFGVLDGSIWVNTAADSIKVHRVARGSPVFFAAGEDGPFIEARAEIVRDPAMADRLGEVYRRKYWIAWLGLFRPKGSRLAAGKTVLIRMMPKDEE